MRYFIIAGEASGDLHASRLITAIRERDPESEFYFIGGDRMAAAAGRQPFIHFSKMAFMGFSEVLRHLGEIRRNLSATMAEISRLRPDAVILVDYAGFNMRVIKKLRAGDFGHLNLSKETRRNLADTPLFYYIIPKVWAWKKWRTKALVRYTDKRFSIFPFEDKLLLDKKGAPLVKYTGNPSYDEVDTYLASPHPTRAEFIEANKLHDRKIIAILPGSRLGEIKNNLPVMLKATERFPQYLPVIACAPGVARDFYDSFGKFLYFADDTYALLSHSHAALVTSGTATLETALFGVPQVVCYRANGSRISYNLMKGLIHVNFVSLPNLIVNQEIIPEMLLHLCTPEAVGDKLLKIIGDTPEREAQLRGYEKMRRELASAGNETSAVITAREIISSLKK